MRKALGLGSHDVVDVHDERCRSAPLDGDADRLNPEALKPETPTLTPSHTKH